MYNTKNQQVTKGKNNYTHERQQNVKRNGVFSVLFFCSTSKVGAVICFYVPRPLSLADLDKQLTVKGMGSLLDK